MAFVVAMVKVYNSEKLLGDCLLSLQGQVHRAIVADGYYPPEVSDHPRIENYSTDKTGELARSFPWVEWIPAPEGGYSSEVHKINTMFGHVREGEWTLWIDDDERLRGNLQEYLRDMQTDADLLPMRVSAPAFGKMWFYCRLVKYHPGLSISRVFVLHYPSSVNGFLGEYHERCYIEHL